MFTISYFVKKKRHNKKLRRQEEGLKAVAGAVFKHVRRPVGQTCTETGQAPDFRESQDPGSSALCLPITTWEGHKKGPGCS